MSAAVLERPDAAAVDADAPGGAVHIASLARHVIETLSNHSKHPALTALDDMAFEAIELLHDAIMRRDEDGGAFAAAKLEQVMALALIMEEHTDSGEWDSLGAARYLLRDALNWLNDARKAWK